MATVVFIRKLYLLLFTSLDNHSFGNHASVRSFGHSCAFFVFVGVGAVTRYTHNVPFPRLPAETQRDIHQRATDELLDAGLDQIHLSFYMTSIYDHSIFEAFSKVVQKLIPQLPVLENLLNILISVRAWDHFPLHGLIVLA
jgi:hypothetical protein